MPMDADAFLVAKYTLVEQELDQAHLVLDIKGIKRAGVAGWTKLSLAQRILLSLGESLPEAEVQSEVGGFPDQ